jgi:glycosyltransferase involved in cell wall biosynthesis
VAPSADLRRRLLVLFPEYANKTVFIHNGIDVEDFASPAAPTRFEKKRYLLSVSAYKTQKALDVLIRAMKTVSKREPDVKLILVGEGDVVRRELESLAAKLGLGGRIEFQGRKNRREVAALLRGCEAFVLPSRFETFGIAILEAMASSRPVVVTKAGGMPEIVRNGVTGFVVEPGNPDALADALVTLCGDADLRHRFGEAGFQDVCQRFHTERMGESYEHVFGFSGGTPSDAAAPRARESVARGVGRP